jgi:hypothetical protein
VPRAKLTTKKLAQRIDLNYFKRPHPLRRWRSILSVALPVLALLWLVWAGLTRNTRVYSSGKMSAGHAVLAARCDECHVREASSFSAGANDRACVACHDGPIHHANQLFTPKCSTCHVEHRGRMRLAATADTDCTECHANLRTTGAPTGFVREIKSFGAHHPEFAALRAKGADQGTVKLNHAVHLKANLLGPNGPVQLDCDDCHRLPTLNAAWRFGAAQPKADATPAKDVPPSRIAARAYMSPIAYAKHCIGCHGLQFDKRFKESVPHDTPQVVHAFVVLKFQQYIAAHPAELRETNSSPDLPQHPAPPSPKVLTQQEWVAERVAESEELLWRKTCKECHAVGIAAAGQLPVVAKSNIKPRWFEHAVFSHDSHKMMKCVECHTAAPTSRETADVLLPGIRACEQCHHSGGDAAEARCFECHTYHDWSKEKEVKGKLTLSHLMRGD